MSSLLEVSGVSVSFDGFKAINNLSFQIGAAELRAIIGPNGAGKTTFMDIVTGKTRPDTGVVKWGDKSVDLLSLDEAQIAQAGVGRKFQKPTVFEDQTVFENLLLALKNHRNVFRVLFYKRRKSDHQKVADLARDISLDSELHRLAGELEVGRRPGRLVGRGLFRRECGGRSCRFFFRRLGGGFFHCLGAGHEGVSRRDHAGIARRGLGP